MALTKKDLQLIREVLKPEFKAIDLKFETLRNEMEQGFKGVYAAMQGLKIYMEIRFRELENKMDARFLDHERRMH